MFKSTSLPSDKASPDALGPGERPVLSPFFLMTQCPQSLGLREYPCCWMRLGPFFFFFDFFTFLQMFQHYLLTNLLKCPIDLQCNLYYVLNSHTCLGQFMSPLFHFTNPSAEAPGSVFDSLSFYNMVWVCPKAGPLSFFFYNPSDRAYVFIFSMFFFLCLRISWTSPPLQKHPKKPCLYFIGLW